VKKLAGHPEYPKFFIEGESDMQLLTSASTRRHKPLFYDLIMAYEPWEIALLEQSAGLTQREVVNCLIEESIWGEDLPNFRGLLGNDIMRLQGLRAVMRVYFRQYPCGAPACCTRNTTHLAYAAG
jgi:hypothetical protein